MIKKKQQLFERLRRDIKGNKYYYIILFGIFLLALVLRSVELLNGNYLFGFDQGRDYLLVKDIVDQHQFRLIGAEVGAGSAGLSGIFHGPGHIYLLSFFYLLFNGDPYGSIVYMFVFGVATVVLTYLISKQFFSPYIALIPTFFIAIAPQIVTQSRFLWNHHPSSFFIIIVFYFVYLIPKNTLRYLPLSLFISGFIYHFELAIAVPLVLSILVYSVVIMRIRSIKIYTFSMISVLLAIMPMIFFDFRHDFLATRGILSYFDSSESISSSVSISRFLDHFQSYLFNMRTTFPVSTIKFGGFISIIFTLFSWIVLVIHRKSLKNDTHRFVKFLFILIIVSWLFFLLLNNTIWNWYLIHLHFAYIFLATYATNIIWQKKIIFGKILVIGFIIINVIAIYSRLKLDHMYDYYDYGGWHKIAGKTDALDILYSDAGGKPFNVLVYTPPVYTYAYEYMFKWYGKNTYSYVPGNDKIGTFYLLMEPDLSQSAGHIGWQETVVKSGEIEWEKELPSGLILQKRTELPEPSFNK